MSEHGNTYTVLGQDEVLTLAPEIPVMWPVSGTFNDTVFLREEAVVRQACFKFLCCCFLKRLLQLVLGGKASHVRIVFLPSFFVDTLLNCTNVIVMSSFSAVTEQNCQTKEEKRVNKNTDGEDSCRWSRIFSLF